MRRELIGGLAIISAAIMMSTLSVFVRNLEGDALVVTFLRFFFGFIIIAFISLLNRDFPKFSRISLLLAIFNLLTIICYISAIQSLEVATAAMLLYMAPVYVIPIAALMGERIERKTLLALPLGLGGLYLMLTPYGELTPGILFGIFSGLSYALVFITSKEARKHYSPLQINFVNLGFGSALLLPYFLLYGSISSLYWAAGLGTIPTAIPFLLFMYGMKYVKVQRAPILALIEPVSAAIIGYMYFGEMLSPEQILGGTMILASVGMVWRE
ncbi:EamA family transporter [Archaeoglobus neptunius]|uniref:EamA family transporter n=1 Tax=Archaeoglobus neptunius TaxID=2798580 RepID=UPI001E34BC14|nr:EamA family transporter [Archaeoglobus neptunius]